MPQQSTIGPRQVVISRSRKDKEVCIGYLDPQSNQEIDVSRKMVSRPRDQSWLWEILSFGLNRGPVLLTEIHILVGISRTIFHRNSNSTENWVCPSQEEIVPSDFNYEGKSLVKQSHFCDEGIYL